MPADDTRLELFYYFLDYIYFRCFDASFHFLWWALISISSISLIDFSFILRFDYHQLFIFICFPYRFVILMLAAITNESFRFLYARALLSRAHLIAYGMPLIIRHLSRMLIFQLSLIWGAQSIGRRHDDTDDADFALAPPDYFSLFFCLALFQPTSHWFFIGPVADFIAIFISPEFFIIDFLMPSASIFHLLLLYFRLLLPSRLSLSPYRFHVWYDFHYRHQPAFFHMFYRLFHFMPVADDSAVILGWELHTLDDEEFTILRRCWC